MSLGIEKIFLLYGITAVVFFLVDLLWLGVVAKDLYARHFGALMRDQVNWTAALTFYAMYIGGIVLFVLVPALQSGWGIACAAAMGGLLGLFAYGTFDLTGLALFRGWPAAMAVVDMVWGTVLTGGTAGIALWLFRNVFKVAI